jgi:Chaperone for flagella basal body P-ring formation
VTSVSFWRTRAGISGFVFATWLSTTASAEAERVVDGLRIELADITDAYSGDLSHLDLGAAPPPGSSRLIERAEVETELRRAGADPRALRMPRVLRVKSAAKHWSAEELKRTFEPALEKAMPRGVKLVRSTLTRGVVTSPRALVGQAHLPPLPKQAGPLTVTATAELRVEDVIVARVPITLGLEVSAEGAAPFMEKGARVTVVIEHGAARVSALAVALADAELGEVAQFRVTSTSRVVRARVEASDSARVVEK